MKKIYEEYSISEPLFLIEQVKYKNILDIETLDIPQGKVTCILGESGAGKSTFLRLLNKLISPDTGEIYYMGQPLSAIDSLVLRQKVVMLMQSPVIYPGTVQYNLNFGLEITGRTPAPENKLLETLQFLELEKLALHGDAATLSGGEKQRICLGRLILMDPQVFLLDEPSAALDENTQELIISRLSKHVKDKGKELIMITHSGQLAKDHAEYLIYFGRDKVTAKKENINGSSSN